MAYDDEMGMPPGAAAGASDTAGGMDTPPPDDMQGPPAEGEQGGDESSLFLTPDMLPPGMKVNAGDILEFKVVNPADQDGHIEVVYNTGKGGEAGEGESAKPSWEDDFRQEMSAREPQQSAE